MWSIPVSSAQRDPLGGGLSVPPHFLPAEGANGLHDACLGNAVFLIRRLIELATRRRCLLLKVNITPSCSPTIWSNFTLQVEAGWLVRLLRVWRVIDARDVRLGEFDCR